MLPAFLTTLLWSVSAIAARKSIAAVGPVRANLTRLALALALLALYAHTAGSGFAHAGTGWFLLSGLFGMGLGDIALFYGMPMVGARLSVLMTQCLATPIAALAEWLWLGTTLSPAQIVWSTTILVGVAVAFFPGEHAGPVRPLGLVLGVCSAACQGLGAVLSRKANDVAALAGQSTDAISAAYIRTLGGFVCAAMLMTLWSRLAPQAREGAIDKATQPKRHTYRWIAANSLCGAVLGVSCYQWALRTTPSGVVLPIVACTPLVILPFSYWLEGEKPSRRSLVGGLIAVAGAVALARVR